MCLRYKPTLVACVCIHLACKWSKYKIPLSAHNKEWFEYVDPKASMELLEALTKDFLKIFEMCPSRLKKKIMQSTQAVSESNEHIYFTSFALRRHQSLLLCQVLSLQ